MQTLINGVLVAGGTCTCTGGPFPGTPIVVTFGGNLAARAIGLISVVNNALTGGTAPAASIAHTTVGVNPQAPVYLTFLPYNILPFAPLGISP
jgi:hypothetical protein